MRARTWGITTSLFGGFLAVACSHQNDAPPDLSHECSAQKPTFSPSPAPEIAKQKMSKKALILDVRTAEEFAAGHLAGAHLMPVQELSSRVAEVKQMLEDDLSRPVVVYCRSGGRATRAARLLHDVGFQDVTNGGGLKDLQAP